jgi:methylphosphotriester-DNA--protein-cysteine methyltransferase
MQPTLTTPGMRYWRIAPDASLRAHIVCYWVMDGERSIVPTEEVLIPDGHSEIIFNRDTNGFSRWRLGERERCDHMSRSYVIGGRSCSIATRSAESLRLAGVKLDSRFLRAVIRTPLSEFRDATVSLVDLGDRRLQDLDHAVALAGSPTAIAALFDRFFLATQRELPGQRTSSDALLDRIRIDRGATSILRWARDARVDARSLERGFCASTGMTPKQYARVIRFKRAYGDVIRQGRAVPLSAQLDGYYDQSHFNREFRFFTGVAPTAKLSGRMPTGMSVSDHLLQVEM